MSDTKVKISELPSVSEVLGTDESPAVQSSTTKKFTMTQLGSYILGAFSGLSLGGVAQTAKAAIDAVTTALGNLSDLVGNTAMGTTATTVTGAIAEHEGEINALDSTSGVQTISLQNMTAGANPSYYIKRGNMMYLFIDGQASTGGTTLTVYTLPAGCRPATPTRWALTPVDYSTGLSGITAFMAVATNGEVTIYQTRPFRTFLSVSFPVA